MKRTRFSEEQVIVLNESEGGRKTEELCRHRTLGQVSPVDFELASGGTS